MIVDAAPLAHLKQHADQRAIPLYTHIDLTWRCDLACVHCYLEERVKHELDLAELQDVLDQIAALGGLFMLFSGGDIFLRPDALDILRAATDRGFYVSIITHAGHITEEVAEELTTMGVALIHVSIYSSRAEVHDRITKVPGSLHASLRAISWLRRRGIAVEMKCPVFADNEGAELEIPLLAARYDCTFKLDHRIIPALGVLPPEGLTGHCDSLTHLNLNVDQQIDVVRAAHGQGFTWAHLQRHDLATPVCKAGRSAVYIDPEGNVSPCLVWEQHAGNLRHTDFTELWNHGEVFELARDTTRKSFYGCATCENVLFCEICPGKAHKETGHARGISAQMCRAATVTRLAFDDREHDLAIDIAHLLDDAP